MRLLHGSVWSEKDPRTHGPTPIQTQTAPGLRWTGHLMEWVKRHLYSSGLLSICDRECVAPINIKRNIRLWIHWLSYCISVISGEDNHYSFRIWKHHQLVIDFLWVLWVSILLYIHPQLCDGHVISGGWHVCCVKPVCDCLWGSSSPQSLVLS